MNIYQVRQQLRTTSIYELPLRVVYYARVSTDKDEQKNSIKNQRTHFEAYIKGNSNWIFCGGYIDDGISGIHAEKREQFQQMLLDAKNGNFDLIITKEISRFARNTLDSILYTRQLLGNGVCVWFQNDNINTVDDDSEFRLTIMAGVAQDEIRKLSSRVRFGHAQSIKNGVVLGNSHLYGYDKKDGRLTINEQEAAMVRMIFEKYATGIWTTPKLEKYLYEMGYRNYKGGKINREVINHIIRNPKYKGYYAGGKVKIIDMFTKKQQFLPPEEWHMYKDDGSRVPAIVDEDVWEKANYYLKQRGDAIKNRRTSFKTGNLFTGKIFCAIDNTAYWMKQRTIRGKEDVRWVCSHKIKNGAASCSSFGIAESELKQMISELINDALGNFDQLGETYVSLYQKIISKKPDHSERIHYLKHTIESTRNKAEKILEYNLAGAISDEEFLRRNAEYMAQIEQMSTELEELSKEPETLSEIKERVEKIKQTLKDFHGLKPDDIKAITVATLIEKIVVYPQEEHTAKIEFYLKNSTCYSGMTSGKAGGCSDHMMKKMIEAQERQMAGK